MSPLRFVTAGSVNDGKSTLIGRLLYDSRAIQEDQLAAVARASARRGAPQMDLSLLTDGLEAEREQGITIDVAYRYFATPRRKFIIADAPGHEQYTRNMATAASTADAAVLLVDVRKQLVEQTRRHLRLARLLGVRHAIAFVNKLDLVGYSQGIFEGVRGSILAFAAPLGFDTLDILPGSALRGDNVVTRGALGWFEGATLLERLESLDSGVEDATAGPLRLPVQLVSRPQGAAARAYLGRIESGVVSAGSEVLVLPAGRRTRVREIVLQGAASEAAAAGDAHAAVAVVRRSLRRGARHRLVHPDRRGDQPHRGGGAGAMTGIVYLVGAGPGAPDLLTLRAARLLGEADIVFHDALIGGEILSLAAKAEKVPVGKRSGKHSTAQRFINKRLADAAARYRVVVRLKGGDPMLFGRAHEEIAFLRARNIPVEIVPGVTAALAASAELGVSLTQRLVSRSVVFVTPRTAAGAAPSGWEKAVAAADTAVLYMAAGDAEGVKAGLLGAGLRADTPVAVAENISLSSSRMHSGTLAELPQLAARSTGGPAVVLIGKVFEALGVRSDTSLRAVTGIGR